MAKHAQLNRHYPDSLAELTKQNDPRLGFFDDSGQLRLHDPWGNPYHYEKAERSYRIYGVDPEGLPSGIELTADMDRDPNGTVTFEPTLTEFLYLSRYSGTLFRVALIASLCAAEPALSQPGAGTRGATLRSLVWSAVIMSGSAVVVSIFLVTFYMLLSHH